MSCQVEENYIFPGRYGCGGTAGARAEASLGLDLAIGDREARVNGNKDRYGDCNIKVGVTESKSKAKSQFQAGMLKYSVTQWQQLT